MSLCSMHRAPLSCPPPPRACRRSSHARPPPCRPPHGRPCCSAGALEAPHFTAAASRPSGPAVPSGSVSSAATPALSRLSLSPLMPEVGTWGAAARVAGSWVGQLPGSWKPGGACRSSHPSLPPPSQQGWLLDPATGSPSPPLPGLQVTIVFCKAAWSRQLLRLYPTLARSTHSIIMQVGGGGCVHACVRAPTCVRACVRAPK